MKAELINVSDAFLKARRELESHLSFPGDLPETLEDAYEIQKRSVELWDDQVIGWKVGGIPAHLQDRFKQPRLAGPIFSKDVRHCADGERIEFPAYPGGFVAVEPEYVLTVGHVETIGDRDVTLEDMPHLITKAHIGIEIASSPLVPINEIGPLAVVSDFGNNGGLIIGPKIDNFSDFDFSKHNVTTHIDGELVGECPAGTGLSGPFGAVIFLLNHMRAQGMTVPDGTRISTGAITGVHDTKIGTHSVIKFEGLGEMQVDLVARKK